jgi:hypothetical protein
MVSLNASGSNFEIKNSLKICLKKTEENGENLYGDGWSQDVIDTYRNVANSPGAP